LEEEKGKGISNQECNFNSLLKVPISSRITYISVLARQFDKQGYPKPSLSRTTNPLPETMSRHPNTESLQYPSQCVLKGEKPDAQLGHPAMPDTLLGSESLQSNATQSKDPSIRGRMLPHLSQSLSLAFSSSCYPVAPTAWAASVPHPSHAALGMRTFLSPKYSFLSNILRIVR